MDDKRAKEYHNWFMKTPASIIQYKYNLKQYEFNLWLEDELPSLEKDIQDLNNYFTSPENYVEELVDRKIMQKKLKEILNLLSKGEQDILHFRFWKNMTLKETAACIGISSERIRQIEARALRKLRHPTYNHSLKAYCYIFE